MSATESTTSPRLELHQTRDFTATEQRELMRLWRKLLWPNGAGRWFSFAWYLCYGFAGFLALSILTSLDRLASVAPQLSLAAIGFLASLALLQWIGARLQRRVYWRSCSVGNRFIIESDGLRGIGRGSESLLRWHGIDVLVCTDRFVTLDCHGRTLLLAKAAFADQDVDGFCRELERRWNESRVPSA